MTVAEDVSIKKKLPKCLKLLMHGFEMCKNKEAKETGIDKEWTLVASENDFPMPEFLVVMKRILGLPRS